MSKRWLGFYAILLCCSVFCKYAMGQANHTIVIGDATNDFTAAENLGAEDGRTAYLTWDATNLYIGIEGNPIVNTFSNVWVVIDTDPATNDDPRSGNGRNDQPTNESGSTRLSRL